MAKEAQAELTRISPVSDTDVILRGGEVHHAGDYAKGWAISTQTAGNTYSKKVWNKTNYQLTHLLEFRTHIKKRITSKTITNTEDT